MPIVKLVPEETVFFLCDVQTRFSACTLDTPEFIL